MSPSDYHLDAIWTHLSREVSAAQCQVDLAEEAVRLLGYLGGRREALAAAERHLSEAQQALADREETISNPLSNTW